MLVGKPFDQTSFTQSHYQLCWFTTIIQMAAISSDTLQPFKLQIIKIKNHELHTMP